MMPLCRPRPPAPPTGEAGTPSAMARPARGSEEASAAAPSGRRRSLVFTLEPAARGSGGGARGRGGSEGLGTSGVRRARVEVGAGAGDLGGGARMGGAWLEEGWRARGGGLLRATRRELGWGPAGVWGPPGLWWRWATPRACWEGLRGGVLASPRIQRR